MASRILLRPLGMTTTITACSVLAAPVLLRRPQIYLSESFSQPTSSNEWQHSKHVRAPMRGVSKGGLDPRIVRQISTGSMLGLIAGFVVSVFSKPLALLLGLLICGEEFLEFCGIHVIPYNRIQRYFQSVKLKSLLQDDVAFKLSFGVTFALAGFASF